MSAVAEQLVIPEPVTELPGHRYQRIGICQCFLRQNDSITGMWGSVDRVGVLARLRMTPAEHAQHIATLTVSR